MIDNTDKTLNYFISYATEDREIAKSIKELLEKSLKVINADEELTHIFIDYISIKAGEEEGYKKDIRQELKKAHRLIIIYTGQKKESHSYTGWEVGYYDHETERQKKEEETNIKSKTIIFYTHQTPKVTQEIQSINIGINNDDLKLSKNDFRDTLNLDTANPIKQFLTDERQVLKNSIFGNKERNVENCYFEANLEDLIRSMGVKIYGQLRVRTSTESLTQKQLIINVKKSDLEENNNDLPSNANINAPELGNAPSAWSIFGTLISIDRNKGMTWAEFNDFIANHPTATFWKDSINRVISSAIRTSKPFDDDQIIQSFDGGQLYRIILTKIITYYDDMLEFHLYFIEKYNRRNIGDKYTSKLLAMLELLARFRFAFLEKASDFNPTVIKNNYDKNKQYLANDKKDNIYDCLQKLIQELNLIKLQSINNELNTLHEWDDIINNQSLLVDMLGKWGDFETEINELIETILSQKNNNNEDIEKSISQMYMCLSKMIETISPYNHFFLIKVIETLKTKIEADFKNLQLEESDYELFLKFESSK